MQAKTPMPIVIRLALWTPYGPAGPRLARALPLPITDFHFPDTPQGRALAEEARLLLQKYTDKYHNTEKKKR